jgi:hypothetical protein
MQFVVKEVSDQQTTLLDDSLRVVHQLLTAWKNAVDKVAAKSHDLTRHDPNRPDLATTLHMAEGFALVRTKIYSTEHFTAKYPNGGLILVFSQFSILPQLLSKILIDSKVVKFIKK